jgi:hypothetical protein
MKEGIEFPESRQLSLERMQEIASLINAEFKTNALSAREDSFVITKKDGSEIILRGNETIGEGDVPVEQFLAGAIDNLDIEYNKD